jgi:hypothetical protein
VSRRTVLIVPPTVPRAKVSRVVRPAPPAAPVATAEAQPVARPSVRPLAPQQLTDEEISRLMAENQLLRDEVARARQRG